MQGTNDAAHQLTPVMIPGECELGGGGGGGGVDYPASVDINGLEQRLSTNTGALMLPESVLSGEESAAAASETAEAPIKVATEVMRDGIVLTPEAFEQLGEFAHQVNDDLPTEPPSSSLPSEPEADAQNEGESQALEPAPTGKGRGRVQPDPNAEGPHTVFKRDPITGKVVKYTTYESPADTRNPNQWETTKRYDGRGSSHYNKFNP